MIKIFKTLNEEKVNNFLLKTKGKIVSYAPNIIVEYDLNSGIDLSRYRHAYYNSKGHDMYVTLAEKDGECLSNEAVELYFSNNSIVGIDSHGDIMEISLNKKDMAIIVDGVRKPIIDLCLFGEYVLIDSNKFTKSYEAKLRKELVELEKALHTIEFKVETTNWNGREKIHDYMPTYKKILAEIFAEGSSIRSMYLNIKWKLRKARNLVAKSDDADMCSCYYSKETIILHDENSYLIKKGISKEPLIKLDNIVEDNDYYISASSYYSPLEVISPMLEKIDDRGESKPLSKFSEMLHSYEIQKYNAKLQLEIK